MIRISLTKKSKINHPPVICIGFNKSGTTSIHKLFEDNRVPSVHWDNGRLAKRCLLNALNGKKLLHGYDNTYNVFSDFMFRTDNFLFEGNSLFRQMNRDYPDSYFVYNKRDIDDWINSRINHPGVVAGLNLLELQKKILSTNSDVVAIEYWKKMRGSFEEEIRDYFKNNKRFIEIDIYDPEFTQKLSSHVNLPLNPIHWKKHGENKLKTLPNKHNNKHKI